MSGSVAAAVLLYGGIGATMVAATATAHVVVEEKLTQIEFAPPPPPPPPPPPEQAPPPTAAPPSAPRPKVKRPNLTPPKEISKEELKESDRPLAEAGDVGPVDGFLDGVEGGKGTAAAPPPPPPPKPEPLIAAVPMSSNPAPRYSASARRKNLEGVVVVSFDVLEDGRVANVRVVSGPEDFRENVMSAVSGWRFQPAKRGGKPVRTHITKTVRFRLEDA